MKTVRILQSVLALTFVLCISFAHVAAQDDPTLAARAAWTVTRFDITARVPADTSTDRQLTVRAVLSIRNVGQGAGRTFTFEINQRAEVQSASVGGATATVRPRGEARNRLQRLTVDLPASITPNGSVDVTIDYRLRVAENDGLLSLSPRGAQALPLSFWYPAPNTIYSARGADQAPMRLTVNVGKDDRVVASGKTGDSKAGDATTYTQTLNAQPFFVTGRWEEVNGTTAATQNVSALLPQSPTTGERQMAAQLIELAAQARQHFTELFGALGSDSPIRLVAVTRGGGYNDGGTLLLDEAAFRRSKLDQTTAMLVAETAARLWIGGATSVRGEGADVVREGLTRHLAASFIEKQFGRDAADQIRFGDSLAFASIAQRDAPLARVTAEFGTYYSLVSSKGALAWRLVEKQLGREAFVQSIRRELEAKRAGGNYLTLASLRQQLLLSAGGEASAAQTLFGYIFDQLTDTDLTIGLPQQSGANVKVALRNAGALAVNVPVVATTERGERLSQNATIAARDFGEVSFQTSARIVRVEIDPEKIYPQIDYANDSQPRPKSNEDALTEADRALKRNDFTQAATLARDALSQPLRAAEAHVLLGRALAGQNKPDEAEREFRFVLEQKLPLALHLARAEVGLGEIFLKRGQATEALKFFDAAVREDAEYASSLTARLGRVRAEVAANQVKQIDPATKAFIAQLDQAIISSRKAQVDALLLPGELAAFSRGLVGNQPSVWESRIVRAEALSGGRIFVDVALNIKTVSATNTGTAVYVLASTPQGLKLADIQLFEVR